MGAFDESCAVEKRAIQELSPFLEIHTNGKYVLTAKGALSRQLQKEYGDVFCNDLDGKILAVEIKAETSSRTGNFFLETWSNFKFGMQNGGWMFHLKCDLLWYYFLDTKDMYCIRFPGLWEWFWNNVFTGRFETRDQTKYEQRNLTKGVLVPIDVVRKEVGLKHFRLSGERLSFVSQYQKPSPAESQGKMF